MRQAGQSLPLIAQAIASNPKLHSSQRMGQRERDPETLVERLCQTHQTCLEFSMPTRAILGRAFVLAKLNFLKALEYLLEEAGEEAHPAAGIVRDLVSEAVFSKLAEELLSALIANASNPMDLRRTAARKLILMWDERLTLPVSELPSVLMSAWRARIRVRAVYGTLIGAKELLSLIKAECEPRFVNYFIRDHVTEDEREAFREFLFGLPYEDLQRIDCYMREHQLGTIRPEQVQELIDSTLHPILLGDPSPEQMYMSYSRRRIRADYRRISNNPGPRKTAEGYIMESLLRGEEASGT